MHDSTEFLPVADKPFVPDAATLAFRPQSNNIAAPVEDTAVRDTPRGWLWTPTQLEPGELRVEANVVDLGAVLAGEFGINRASLHALRAPKNCVSLLTCSQNTGTLFIGGHELTSDRSARIEPGAEVELVAHRASACLLISLEKTSPTCPTAPQPGAAVSLLWCSPDVAGALADQVREAVRSDASSTSPAVQERVRELACRLLSGSQAMRSESTAANASAHRESARWRAAVETAREYIRSHLNEPLRLADLCRCTHLKARSLEYGFREIVRLSPMRYVRMVRLGEVRRQLLKPAATRRSISEIALDAGFSHLSQFSVDYKKVYGETPSATRHRTLTALPPRRKNRRHGARSECYVAQGKGCSARRAATAGSGLNVTAMPELD